jgi:hypothetical protein
MRPNPSYRPSDLVQAFDSAWRVIEPKHPIAAWRADRLRLDLAKVIIRLAENGVTDPRELRRLAVEQLILEV